MGLDMYLTKKIDIGAQYSFNKVEGSINITKDGEPINIDLSRVDEIAERVGYWRKANQIHKWFVTNVQEGVDNCDEYYVSEDELKQLLADCKAVKENSHLAEQVMPTQKGFFFGGTEYDEFYMNDIDNTIEIVEAILKERDKNGRLNGTIYYQSSW